MARNFKRKTPKVSESALEQAIEAVRSGEKLRTAAQRYAVPRATLQRRVKIPILKKHPKQIFTIEQEAALTKYLLRSAAMYYGLSLKTTCLLAYQFAKSIGIKMPASWQANKIAGIEWLRSFSNRHRDLTLRRPESTSIARATAFNPYDVRRFFTSFLEVMDRKKYKPNQIFNMDETGFSTIPNLHSKIICMKGVRTIAGIASAEGGKMMTVALAVSADGRSIPPFFIFPRAKMKPEFLLMAPVGSGGSANLSGWMKADEFLKFLHHFQKHVQPSANNPVLLLLDNHDSYLSIAALDFCKENCICVLSFPPHCTHELQPLDRTVFGPLKTKYYEHCEIHLRTHPRVPITMLNIPSIVKAPIDFAVTKSNILAGFECTGISPVNPDKFTAIDLSPSQVSDRDFFEYVAQPKALADDIPAEIGNEVYHPDDALDPLDISIDGDLINEEFVGDDSLQFDNDYENIKPNSFENVNKPIGQANFKLVTFGNMECGNGQPAVLPQTTFTNSIDEDSLDHNNTSSNGFESTDNAGAMRIFNEGSFTKDDHTTFGDFIASELRNMKTDEFRRKLRRVIQKCVLDVTEEEDTMLAKQHA